LSGAEKVRTAQDRLHDAYNRRRLVGGDARWSDAVIAMKTAQREFYNVVADRMRLLRQDDAEGIAYAIAFLESDPWCFRSGYSKERMLTILGRCTVSSSDVGRLQAVALRAVRGPQRREFGYYCQLVRRRLDVAPIRSELRSRLHSGEHGEARRAMTMLLRLKRVKLSVGDRERARAILERAAADPDPWPDLRWVEQSTRRFWEPAWEHRLVTDVRERGRSAVAPLRLVSMPHVLHVDLQERADLQRLLLELVDEGGDENWLEQLAALIATKSLERDLEARLTSRSEAVRRRASWALGRIRGEREPKSRRERPGS
jgi:hypothetical protein